MAKSLFILICMTVLVNCGDGRSPKLEKYSDNWIYDEAIECETLENPSRIKAMACENYKRECKARKLDCY